MSIQGGPYSISDSSLILHLDAGNLKSYLSGSSTWNDLSGNGNNGTLTNGPTFTTTGSGGLVFNGVNNSVDISYDASKISFPNNNATICAWYKVTPSSDYSGCLVSQRSSGGSGFQTYVLSNKIYADGGGTSGVYSTTTLSAGTIAFATFVYDKTNSLLKLYLNGIYESQTSYTGNIQDTYPIKIGNGAFGDGPFPGDIYTASVYNRALSSAEVLQNYNATKSRFGL